MSNITALNNELHRDIRIKRSNDFSRFSQQHLVPITVQDFTALASEFPIIFVKNAETGQFTPVAMMGIKEGVNLYCQETTYPAAVFPKGFLNAPLSLAKLNKDSDDATVLIDLDSPLIDEQGEALFNEAGEKTKFFESYSQHLLDVAEFTIQTQAITQFFANEKLFVQQTLTVTVDKQGGKQSISGAYIINEEALNALDDSRFIELKTKGLLPLIYAHLNSLYQVGRLSKLQVNQ